MAIRLKLKKVQRWLGQTNRPTCKIGGEKPTLAKDEPASHLHKNMYDDGEQVHIKDTELTKSHSKKT